MANRDFFQMDKKELDHKKLWRQSENAVKIHIGVAICNNLFVALGKYEMKSNLSIYEIIQILGISIFDKTPLSETNQKDKEQLNLFDN